MISKVMKRKYITPVVYFFKFEEESELLGHSLQKDADSEFGASDYTHNAVDGKSEIYIKNPSTLTQDEIGAKDHDWFFDDNAFSDF